MARKLGSIAALMGLAFVLLLDAASASATAPMPPLQQFRQVSVPKPNGIAYDGYNDEAYVSSVGPPPRVYRLDAETGEPLGSVDLPSDADPGGVYWGPDDYLYVIDHAKDRIFRVCPECGSVTEIATPASVQFITGYIDAYQTGPFLLDFGDGFSAGSLWFGGGFGMRLAMPDTITPNGGAILPDTERPSGGRIQDELLAVDAENNQIVRVSDTPTPAFLGTIGGLPGNPGLQPPRDLDVNPLNLNPDVSGPAIHPIFVAFPDLGVYESLGPNGPWTQIAATGIGRPTQIASDCTTVGTTSFSQNLVTFFKQEAPKGTHCEDFVELLLKPSSGTPLTLAGGLKAYVDGGGNVNALFGGKSRSAYAAKARKKGKKLKLTAGRVTKFKVKLPAGVAAALRKRHKAIVTVKIKITSPAGQKTTVIRQVRIRSH